MARSFITSTTSMLATLAIAYGIDRWIYFQFNLGRSADVRTVTSSIGSIIGGLITGLIWVALIWMNIYKTQSTKTTSIIFILAGILAFIWFPLELISPFWLRYLFLFPTHPANFQFTGLLISALGLLTILVPRRKPSTPLAVESSS